MESHREERQKALEPNAGQKPRRFRLVKLEERIAPKGGRKTNTCGAGSMGPTYCNDCTVVADCNW